MIVKGPNGCRYLDDAERQARYIRDGWNLSGDLCKVDEDGYIYYEARTDDMILTGGTTSRGSKSRRCYLSTLRCANAPSSGLRIRTGVRS